MFYSIFLNTLNKLKNLINLCILVKSEKILQNIGKYYSKLSHITGKYFGEVSLNWFKNGKTW